MDTTVPVPLAPPVGLADDDTEEDIIEEEPPQEAGFFFQHHQHCVLILFFFKSPVAGFAEVSQEEVFTCSEV